MSTNRPTQVQVGVFLYNVIYSHEEIQLVSAQEGQSLVGFVDHHSLVIIVNDAAEEQVIRSTLLHEVLHCLWKDVGIGADMMQEDSVGCLTPRLLQLLRENPVLLEYLTSSDDEQLCQSCGHDHDEESPHPDQPDLYVVE